MTYDKVMAGEKTLMPAVLEGATTVADMMSLTVTEPATMTMATQMHEDMACC